MLPGQSYHFFNRANGWENLFAEEKNYLFFRGRLEKYVTPVVQFFAYSMIPRQFHLCGRIKEKEILMKVLDLSDDILNTNRSISSIIERKVSKKFSNCFNSYTLSFNKVYARKGSLFVPNFKKDNIDEIDELKKVIHFIHANPVQHKLVERLEDWPHSSYPALIGKGRTFLDREFVLGIFGGVDEFIAFHQKPVDMEIDTLE